MTTMTLFYFQGIVLENMALPSAPAAFKLASHMLVRLSTLNINVMVLLTSNTWHNDVKLLGNS